MVNPALSMHFHAQDSYLYMPSDSNPGPLFTIPEFGIEKFIIPGSRQDYTVGRYFSKLNKSRQKMTTQKGGKAP